MIWLSIAVSINSVAIIAILRSKMKSRDSFKALNDRINDRIDQNQIRCDKALEAIEDLKMENRNIRSEVIEKMQHQPLNDSAFIYERWNGMRFSNGKEINNKFLNYVASIALKTIVSELPEEIQTQEIVGEIINRTKNELAKSKIRL